MTDMITITFPDGANRSFEPGITGLDIAKGISPSLAKRTIAMALDGVVSDLADPIAQDSRIEFLGRDDPRALELQPEYGPALAGLASTTAYQAIEAPDAALRNERLADAFTWIICWLICKKTGMIPRVLSRASFRI